VHELYFNPEHEEFQPRTMRSLSNAFTSGLKELDPIPQFRPTAKLGRFLEAAACGVISQNLHALKRVKIRARSRLFLLAVERLITSPNRAAPLKSEREWTHPADNRTAQGMFESTSTKHF
jgi:hypothetical protein